MSINKYETDTHCACPGTAHFRDSHVQQSTPKSRNRLAETGARSSAHRRAAAANSSFAVAFGNGGLATAGLHCEAGGQSRRAGCATPLPMAGALGVQGSAAPSSDSSAAGLSRCSRVTLGARELSRKPCRGHWPMQGPHFSIYAGPRNHKGVVGKAGMRAADLVAELVADLVRVHHLFTAKSSEQRLHNTG